MTAYSNSAVHTNSRCSVTAALSKRSMLAGKRGSNLVRECVHTARLASERVRGREKAVKRAREKERPGEWERKRSTAVDLRFYETKKRRGPGASERRARARLCRLRGLSPFERFSLGTSRCAAIGGSRRSVTRVTLLERGAVAAACTVPPFPLKSPRSGLHRVMRYRAISRATIHRVKKRE